MPPQRTTFTVHGNTYTFDQLPQTTDDRWEMGGAPSWPSRPTSRWQRASTRSPSRPAAISYMPVPGGGRDSKRLTLAA